MDIMEKIFEKLRIFDEPAIYIMIVASFFSGFWLCPSLSDRGFSLLVGIFVALTAFVGVVYSKNRELILKKHEINLQKTEDFAVNLFQWLESLDRLFIITRTITTDVSYRMSGVVAEEHSEIKESMTKSLTHKGKHLALITLYRDAIVNNETESILNEIFENQERGMSIILKMLKSSNEYMLESYAKEANVYFGLMRAEAQRLMTMIKVP